MRALFGNFLIFYVLIAFKATSKDCREPLLSYENYMIDLLPSRSASARNDILSGLTVALALVPEAVAFAFVAGVEPLVGLYAAFMVGLITACIGGRPGMISGATGALAVVMVALVADHGVEYLIRNRCAHGHIANISGRIPPR